MLTPFTSGLTTYNITSKHQAIIVICGRYGDGGEPTVSCTNATAIINQQFTFVSIIRYAIFSNFTSDTVVVTISGGKYNGMAIIAVD